MKFRKRPLIVEAFQWFKNGDHPKDFFLEGGDNSESALAARHQMGWEGQVVKCYPRSTAEGSVACGRCKKPIHEHGWLDVSGGQFICSGDWIVTGTNGEYYRWRADNFEATFENIDHLEIAETVPARVLHRLSLPEGKTPSRQTNRELRLDAIVCCKAGCDFKRVIDWGTPEKIAPAREIMASHTIDHFDHEMGWPMDVEDGMLFATEEEIRIGRAWLNGLFAGRKEIGRNVRSAIADVLKRYGVED